MIKRNHWRKSDIGNYRHEEIEREKPLIGKWVFKIKRYKALRNIKI